MKKLSHAEIATHRISLDKIDSIQRAPIVTIVDSVRSLYNVGSIFRTSDGAMIQKLILTGFTPYPPRKEIEKTALGSTKSIPWEYHKSVLDAISEYKNKNYKIFCLELTDTSFPYFKITHSQFPLCLVIGNEITGVSKEVIQLCDASIEIPMFGTKQSLNVAVAYGIALFELQRIWRNT